jgi:hypothetical protein
MGEEVFYQVPTFPLLHASHGPAAPLRGPLVYATRAPPYRLLQVGITCSRINTWPPSSDTMLEDPPSTSPTIKPR